MTGTGWKCDRCNRVGLVTHDDDAGVLEVIELLRQAHEQKNPDCTFDVTKVQVELHEEGARRRRWRAAG